MNKYWKHFKTIIKHKWEVGKVCFKFGLYWQGLVHDMSKFSITEFAPSARYFQGHSSPIDKEKEEKGYSAAWLHHKARNKHHPWYWMDWDTKQNPVPCRIPINYVYEMVADWIGAGKVYNNNAGVKWDSSEPYEYYKIHNRESESGFPIWDFCTQAVLDTMLVDLKEFGLNFVAERVKDNYYYFKYYCNLISNDGRELLSWLFDYNELVIKYYNKEENDD